MYDRTHRLYQLAQRVGNQPIDWSNAAVARLQQEMRLDFTEKTPTLSLIAMASKPEDVQPLIRTLGEIHNLTLRPMDFEAALGEGRR